MKSIRQLCFALVLTLALAGTSLAGDMNSPPAPAPGNMNSTPTTAAPGDMNSPPAPAPGDMNSTPTTAAPGDMDAPPRAEIQAPGMIAFLFSLVGF